MDYRNLVQNPKLYHSLIEYLLGYSISHSLRPCLLLGFSACTASGTLQTTAACRIGTRGLLAHQVLVDTLNLFQSRRAGGSDYPHSYSRVWNKRSPLNKHSPLETLAKRISIAPFFTLCYGVWNKAIAPG